MNIGPKRQPEIFRILAAQCAFDQYMKAHSLALSLAAIGVFAVFATPAEAGGCRKHHRITNDNCYRGGLEYDGYYQQSSYATAATTGRARYVAARYYTAFHRTFQIGFVFGRRNGYWR